MNVPGFKLVNEILDWNGSIRLTDDHVGGASGSVVMQGFVRSRSPNSNRTRSRTILLNAVSIHVIRNTMSQLQNPPN